MQRRQKVINLSRATGKSVLLMHKKDKKMGKESRVQTMMPLYAKQLDFILDFVVKLEMVWSDLLSLLAVKKMVF